MVEQSLGFRYHGVDFLSSVLGIVFFASAATVLLLLRWPCRARTNDEHQMLCFSQSNTLD
jgi:hypothetical protein